MGSNAPAPSHTQAYADEVALAGTCSAPMPRNTAEAVFLSRDRTSSCASDAATWIGQITDQESVRGRLVRVNCMSVRTNATDLRPTPAHTRTAVVPRITRNHCTSPRLL